MTDYDLVVKYRRPVLALLKLNLRDRWGYSLEMHKLAEITEYLVQNLDRDDETLVNSLALAMITHDIPMACSGYDTPPEDDLLKEIIRTVKEKL